MTRARTVEALELSPECYFAQVAFASAVDSTIWKQSQSFNSYSGVASLGIESGGGGPSGTTEGASIRDCEGVDGKGEGEAFWFLAVGYSD